MSAAQNRLDLKIDIFEATNQLASVLPTLTPPELIKAIIEEFQELEYLSHTPELYRLVKADGTALKQADPLGAQNLSRGSRLILVEQEVKKIPDGGRPLTRPVYLREIATGQVYKLNWQPAVIGRPDKKLPNDKLAVNLEPHPNGQYVSRRHAQVIEENGQFYLESLSSGNPTFIQNATGLKPVASKEPLSHGDLIQLLDRNKIVLKFIIRPEAAGEKS